MIVDYQNLLAAITEAKHCTTVEVIIANFINFLIISVLGTRIREKKFFVLVINNWNALSQKVVSAPSLNGFRAGLEKFWETLPIKFNFEADSRISDDL